jgi:serine-type D-Ala-D-Ala carboxypeptidase/endopeptidase (penicillin-binding protein 4)
LDSNGAPFYTKHEKKILLPSSGMKALTTATALNILGPDYQYTTQLAYAGEINEKKLIGDLYIIGSGDPTLGSAHFPETKLYDVFFENWKNKIKNLGVDEIQGNIIPEVTYFTDNEVPQTWMYEDVGNYYGAAATALNFKDNEYEITFNENRKPGDKASIVYTSPYVKNYTFENQVKVESATAPDNAYIFGNPFEKMRFVKGTIPAGDKTFNIKGATPYPPYSLCYMLKEKLFASEMIIRYKEPSYPVNKLPAMYTILGSISSPKLTEILRITNQKSINFYAESLLKTVGKVYMNDGSTKGGVNGILKHWLSKGLDLSSDYITDGSGLSRVNAISSEHLAKVFHLMTKEKHFKAYYQTLSVAGKSGTMSRLCAGKTCEARIAGKTGTMERVVSYSGYIHTIRKGRLSFSIIINNFTCKPSEIKAELEKVFNSLVEM